MRTDLLCFDCLDLYGGEERCCPSIPNCRGGKYEKYDSYKARTTERSTEPRYIMGRGGKIYPAEMYQYSYGRRYW